MSSRWVDRRFDFTLPEALFPVVAERLRGTPARIEDKVRSLSTDILTRRDGDAWSIQEHIGHLLDLDELHTGRLDDFLAGAEVLRPADMTNRRTWEGRHNERPIAELLQDFRRERLAMFVSALQSAEIATVARPGAGHEEAHPALLRPRKRGRGGGLQAESIHPDLRRRPYGK